MDHKATNRDWSNYEFFRIDYAGTYIYKCIECRIKEDKYYHRLRCRIENERKQKEYSDRLFWEKYRKRVEKMRNRDFELWDYTIERKIKREIKNHNIKIPIEFIRLVRSTILLKRLIFDKKTKL